MALKTPTIRRRTDVRGRRVLPADRARSANPTEGLLLDGRRLEMQAGDRLLDARRRRTIEGPNQITIALWDGDRALLRSGVFGEKVMTRVLRLEVDGLAFCSTGLRKDGERLSVSFEDDEVTRLKRHGRGKPQRFARGDWTRAQACAHMIRSAGVPVLVLDENVVQPIAGRRKLASELRKARAGASGSSRTEAKGTLLGDVTVKGARATSEQRRNVAKALKVAADVGASEKATLAMLVAGIAEGQWVTGRPNAEGSGAIGPFQIMPATARGLGISPTDVAAGAQAFLVRSFRGGPTVGAIAVARKNPTWTPGKIADVVEGGGAGEAFYQDWINEAHAWLEASKGSELGNWQGHSWVRQFAFERRKEESTWAACWRLLVDEAKWRLFVREGVVVIASDPALMRADPSLAITGRGPASPFDIDFDWHRAQRVGEATTSVFVDRWQADPGEVVAVDDLPQVTRNWILGTVEDQLIGTRSLADITLLAPKKPPAEPASDIAQSNDDSGDPNATGIITTAGGARGIVDQAAALAARVGGSEVYVGSSLRPGSTTSTGSESDHAHNDSSQAARDIGVRGIDLIVGPPNPALDHAVIAIGKAFGRRYKLAQTIVDTFEWNGWRVQIIWRTPEYGGHMGHIHLGVRRAR